MTLQNNKINCSMSHPVTDAESVTVSVPARLLGVTSTAVYHRVWSGSRPCVRIGGSVLLRRDGLDAVTQGKTA